MILPTFDARNAGGAWWNLFGAIPTANCLAAYQPKGAASLSASYVNLTGTTAYNLTTTSAPDWDATNGWKKNSDLNFLDTAVVPSSGWSMIIRFTNHANTGAYSYICGESTANANIAMSPKENTSNRGFYNSGGIAISGALTSGVMAVAGLKGYTNGSVEAGSCAAWSTTTTKTIYILGANGLLGVNAPDAAYVQAFVIYNNDQAANMAALYTAIAAL